MNMNLVVSQNDPGCYQSIDEAISKADPGAVIRVRSGNYQENIVINQPLKIMGEGERSSIVITGTDQNGVLIQTDSCELMNLTLRQSGDSGIAVKISQGEVAIENCEISSDYLGIWVDSAASKAVIQHCKIDGGIDFRSEQGSVTDCEITSRKFAGITIGRGANPTIAACEIHDCAGSGIWISDEGSGLIEGCNISANGFPGISVENKSSPTIRGCQIHHHTSSGINITGNSAGTIEDCDIFANNGPGVAILESSNPTIRGCRIHDGQENGIVVRSNSSGTIEDCDIFANIWPGIAILENSNPTVRRCKIHDGQGNGIVIKGNSSGTIEDCEVFGHVYHEIAIEGANPTVRGCKIHDSQRVGIFINDQGQGQIIDCDIFANAQHGLYVEHGSNPLVRGCKIHDGQSKGIYITESSGTIENCDIFANIGAGIAILEGSDPIVRGCKIHDGQTNGIFVGSHGSGTIEGCDIFAHVLSEVYIEEGGNPTVRRCKIYDSKDAGVFVNNKGQGQIEDCDIFANANFGICISNDGNPYIRKCRIYNGQSYGIWVGSNGIGSIEDCEIFGNGNLGVCLEDGSKSTVLRCKTDDASADSLVVAATYQTMQPAKPEKQDDSVESSLEELLSQLDDMIGLNPVKQAVRSIVDTELANQRMRAAGFEVEEAQTRHMLFAGNPGTGKTTVARLIGKIFKQLGILKTGSFVEAQRDSLVGQYLGHTAVRTTELVQSALDGILFIDEAYSLITDENDYFGREAINTLIALMENNRDRLIVVFAGYPNDMETFLGSNPGLKSRIAFYIDFPDYTGEEMHSIFLSLCRGTKPGWICTEPVSERLKVVFDQIYQQRGRNFANGRDVRNLFEDMLRRLKSRIITENLSGDSMRTFTLSDVPSKF